MAIANLTIVLQPAMYTVTAAGVPLEFGGFKYHYGRLPLAFGAGCGAMATLVGRCRYIANARRAVCLGGRARVRGASCARHHLCVLHRNIARSAY